MNTCWKCGQPTGNGEAECDACQSGIPPQLMETLREARLREIDWDKVHTVEDYRLILSHTFSHIAIPENHPAFELLKRFLK